MNVVMFFKLGSKYRHSQTYSYSSYAIGHLGNFTKTKTLKNNTFETLLIFPYGSGRAMR